MEGLPAHVAERLQALTHVERAAAYLHIDADLMVIGAGGDLDRYGLGGAQPGVPVLEHAYFLEGLLPLPESPFFMPELELAGGNAADLHAETEEETDAVWVLLLDVTAERDAARRMQQKAYEMTLLQEREAQLNRQLEAANAALLATQKDLRDSNEALTRTQERLRKELDDASLYIRSLLPAPLSAPFTAEWCFVPSTELGGDAFGYHWLDPEHFAFYLLDVCGHGIGPSLLSVAVLHLLQAASLREVDFQDPAQVLAALNQIYQMENDRDLFFTLWYGVYQPAQHLLKFACAGHPPVLLLNPATGETILLDAGGLPIGLMPDTPYATETTRVPEDWQLYLFSDGAYEVERPDGTMMSLSEFVDYLKTGADLDSLYRYLLAQARTDTLEDDFSIMRFGF